MRSEEGPEGEKGSVAGNAGSATGGASPEANVRRNPQNGQAVADRSLADGDPAELSDGGAHSARHTGDKTGNP
jgi:hypothetical protein